jgi:hypothetical protein
MKRRVNGDLRWKTEVGLRGEERALLPVLILTVFYTVINQWTSLSETHLAQSRTFKHAQWYVCVPSLRKLNAVWQLTWAVRETPVETASDEWRRREASHATRIHIRVLIWTGRQRERRIILREAGRVTRHKAGLNYTKHRAHSRTSSRNFLGFPTSPLCTHHRLPFPRTIVSCIKLSSVVADVKDFSRMSECSCYSVFVTETWTYLRDVSFPVACERNKQLSSKKSGSENVCTVGRYFCFRITESISLLFCALIYF